MDKQTATVAAPQTKERQRVYTSRHTFPQATGSRPVIVRGNHRGWGK